MAEAPLIQGLFASQLMMLAIGGDGGIKGSLIKGHSQIILGCRAPILVSGGLTCLQPGAEKLLFLQGQKERFRQLKSQQQGD